MPDRTRKTHNIQELCYVAEGARPTVGEGCRGCVSDSRTGALRMRWKGSSEARQLLLGKGSWDLDIMSMGLFSHALSPVARTPRADSAASCRLARFIDDDQKGF